MRIRQTASRLPEAFICIALFCVCIAVFAFVRTSAASDRPTLAHDLLHIPTAERPSRMHRFRLPMAQLHTEVVDLGFVTPVADALGHGDLVVNGGFWEWHKLQRRAMGLLASSGKVISPLRAALQGGVLLVGDGRARIVPSHGFAEPLTVDLALQCRPRLVQAGKVIPELNAHSRAARTAVCVREAGRTLDVYVSDPNDVGPTLQELGVWLLGQGCEHALNLDGGPSTAAAFHEKGKVMRIGPGVELPYAVRFTYAALHGSSAHAASSYANTIAARSRL